MNDAELDRARHYYDDWSASYDSPRSRGYHAFLDRMELDVLAPYVGARSVLEAGCGTGLLLERVVRSARDAVGIDLSTGMLARARGRGLSVVRGSIDALPFARHRFDTVYSFKVLAHVPRIGRALDELIRVTRPGGHVLVEFYNPWSLRWLAKRALGPGRTTAHVRESDVFTRWDTVGDVLALLPDTVEVVEIRGIRVATPAAFVHAIPGLASVVQSFERALSSTSFAKFAGFVIFVLRKR